MCMKRTSWFCFIVDWQLSKWAVFRSLHEVESQEELEIGPGGSWWKALVSLQGGPLSPVRKVISTVYRFIGVNVPQLHIYKAMFMLYSSIYNW